MTDMSGRREYRTVDKTEWLDGPWADEPDKVVWVDEATGLDCMIVRGPLGALCGYVGVAPEHPYHGKDCWGDDGGPDVDVHCGLTYAAACQPEETDATGVCHVPEPGRADHIWWFGFDCAHFRDIVPGMEAREWAVGMVPIRMPDMAYRTIAYVTNEIERLAAQLAALA